MSTLMAATNIFIRGILPHCKDSPFHRNNRKRLIHNGIGDEGVRIVTQHIAGYLVPLMFQSFNQGRHSDQLLSARPISSRLIPVTIISSFGLIYI